MIVLDANILIRAVLGRRVRHLLETYAAQGFRFVTPGAAFDDAQRYLPRLLEKRGKKHADVGKSLAYLNHLIEPSIGNFTANLKEKPGSVCAAVMKTTGRYWLSHSVWIVRFGVRTRISSGLAWRCGQPIGSKSF